MIYTQPRAVTGGLPEGECRGHVEVTSKIGFSSMKSRGLTSNNRVWHLLSSDFQALPKSGAKMSHLLSSALEVAAPLFYLPKRNGAEMKRTSKHCLGSAMSQRGGR